MSFTSFSFLFFLFAVVLLVQIVPKRFYTPLLLFVSLWFYYMLCGGYMASLLFSILSTYAAARWIEAADTPRLKKTILLCSAVLNFGILFACKYLNFFLESITIVLGWMKIAWQAPAFSLLLPLGISFYTFQATSYLFDVYRNKIPAEKNILSYALYVSFFPQITSGPITRAESLLYQIHHPHRPCYTQIKQGLFLFLQGLFYKLVIADHLALTVNCVFDNVLLYGTGAYLLATLYFTFQIYLDFLGYSAMALGVGKMLGLQLAKNFERPYMSASIQEFWRRWHISLSTWFRDYLYIPLGGNRKGTGRKLFNIFIVFIVSGLWHGASLPFVLWGALNGLYQIVSQWTTKLRKRFFLLLSRGKTTHLPKRWQCVFTFMLVAFGWVFFRANTIQDLGIMARNIYFAAGSGISSVVNAVGLNEVLFGLGGIILMLIVEQLQSRKRLYTALQNSPLPLRWSVYLGALLLLVLFGMYGQSTTFIYFNF